MVRPIVLAGLVAILPTVMQAQGRGMASGGGHAMSAAPRAVAHTSAPVSAAVRPAARMAVRSGVVRPQTTIPGTRIARAIDERRYGNRALRSRCASGVPGLGFDAAHLAAVCGSSSFGNRFGNQLGFFPFFNGGFFLPDSSASSEAAAPDEQGYEQAYDQGYQDASADASATGRRVRGPQPPVEAASAAPSENEGYVFVRRDGTVFFAVAYTWEDGTLRYITSDGLRRSVAREALDLNATQQFNEQRGLSFRSPA